jgi:hypothetical protein
MAARVPAEPVEVPAAGFAPKAEQAGMLAEVLAGVELGAWDSADRGLAGGLGCLHGADHRVVGRPFAGGRTGR